ncbi:anti-anti-sigma factor [Pseudonocardia sulfidoxydans NBRC 16205]|uniref:Anti-anti-sigma factor n=1 Tax=Pseudonocardia sulfidoxydans NBRC 16205 TaxID=1223511 RepID=A0A511DLZ4_9PSEU|nr:ATP-binding protein [Pseudonocardia sulfidoxydans]GEL25836.1 anti-anti-sigma factor [Pseudonocardia sulfidoxydans NBRC 16205]
MAVEKLTLRTEDGPDVATVVCAGELDLAGSTRLRRVLGKHLFDRGRLLVDVRALQPGSAAHVAVFSTVLARAGGWPHARMVLVAGDGPVARVMRLAGDAREVPVATDRPEALERLTRRPDRVRRSTELPSGPHAAGFVRELVKVACADWELPDQVRDRAVLVADELTANAVLHTAGPTALTLTVDDLGLRVAVRDGTSRPPPLPAGPGTGLGLVAGLSDAQGVSPHLTGKTVWVLLRRPAG